MPKLTRQLEKFDARTDARLQYIGRQFEGFEKNGTGYKALCPVHDDKKPSLSIGAGSDGCVLLNCFAGCSTEDVIDAVGMRWADLMPNARLVEAIGQFEDENRNVLYEEVRYVGKEIRLRKPKPGGGWLWKLGEVRRVLYRLPELIEADSAEPVFVTEGFGDANRLREGGCVATTNVCGAKGAWTAEYTETLRDRNVVILPDNDLVGKERGDKIAEKLAGVAKSVKVLDLPGLPEKGDVSDWLNAGGTVERLREIADATPPYEPYALRDYGTNRRVNRSTEGSEPYGTDQTVVRSPVGSVVPDSFPLEALPAGLAKYVQSIADALPCPVDFPGAMVLAVLAACIGRKRGISPKASWTEYPVLWVAVVARSGERKSPAFDAVTKPLRKIQGRLYAEYLSEKAKFENDERDLPPTLKQILTTDTTIEALKDILAANPTGVIYPADELSGFTRSMSQYKSGKGDDRQHWLSIWSGAQIVCNRRSSSPLVINTPFVSVTGGIQPDALGDVIDDGREDGMSARFLFAYPDPVPHRDWTEDVVKDDVFYTSVCEELWRLSDNKIVKLAPNAKQRFIEWVNEHRRDEPPDNLRPFWSKCEGYCLRLALVLYLTRRQYNETKGVRVDLESVTGAIKLIEYFQNHAQRVYGKVAVQSDRGRIGKFLQFVKKHGGSVTARMTGLYGYAKDSDDAKRLFDELAEHGHGSVTEEARNSVKFWLNEPTALRDNETTDAQTEKTS